MPEKLLWPPTARLPQDFIGNSIKQTAKAGILHPQPLVKFHPTAAQKLVFFARGFFRAFHFRQYSGGIPAGDQRKKGAAIAFSPAGRGHGIVIQQRTTPAIQSQEGIPHLLFSPPKPQTFVFSLRDKFQHPTKRPPLSRWEIPPQPSPIYLPDLPFFHGFDLQRGIQIHILLPIFSFFFYPFLMKAAPTAPGPAWVPTVLPISAQSYWATGNFSSTFWANFPHSSGAAV